MHMKSWLMGVMVASLLAVSLAPMDAEARRFGGGKSLGMQRTAPAKPAQNTPPTQATPNSPAPANAAAPTAGAATAAAAPRRSWMGPVAGLAAGLGIAALFSHLGLGAELANFVMLALLAVVAFVVIRLVMRRFAGAPAGGSNRSGLSYAASGATTTGRPDSAGPPAWQRELPASAAIGAGSSEFAPPTAAPTPSALPAGFDAEGFERIARMIFIRMQAANDAADLNDLRNFTTPELFAAARVDLLERGPAPQATDVVKIDARVLDVAEEDGQQIVSVHYEGLLREEAGSEAAPFDEVWHLVKPVDGSREWAIAGIQQRQ
jgi:predicted lipid-binding transport protein (Tim44 family)